jgi:hypothetical protein
MHKIHTIILCCTLLAASLGCTATPAMASELVGTWQYDGTQGFICLLRFNLDGTFDGHIGKKKEEQIAFVGTWERKENRILYTYKQPSPGKDEDKIIALEPTYLIIQAKDGAQRRYHRINDGKK